MLLSVAVVAVAAVSPISVCMDSLNYPAQWCALPSSGSCSIESFERRFVWVGLSAV